MSEEQTFLNAIAASPFDDTPRLVYADWLDEHGEPAKAAYLRLVVSLVPLLEGEDPDPAATERLLENATLLPLDWRMATAARFMVVLYGFEPSKKIQTIKVVRELTEMGLREAKDFVESVPRRFPMRTTLEGALGIRSRLAVQAEGQVGVHPCDAPVLPRMASYRVVAQLIDYDYFLHSEMPPAIPAEAEQAFRDFLVAAIGRVPDPVTELEYIVELASGLEPAELERRMQDWRALLPPEEPNHRWEIGLYSYFEQSPPPG